MEVTFRAHPKVSIQTAEIAFIANGAASFNAYLNILTQNANKWAADGWGGYISFGATERYLAGMTLFNPKLSLAGAQASMAPAINFAKSFTNGISLASTVTSSGSFYSTYKSYILPNEDPVGVSQSMASRLIPSSLLATAVFTTTSTIRSLIVYRPASNRLRLHSHRSATLSYIPLARPKKTPTRSSTARPSKYCSSHRLRTRLSRASPSTTHPSRPRGARRPGTLPSGRASPTMLTPPPSPRRSRPLLVPATFCGISRRARVPTRTKLMSSSLMRRTLFGAHTITKGCWLSRPSLIQITS
jgi:hypothetical protein